MHENLDELKFRPDTDTNTRVICPCASEKLLYNVVTTLASSFLAHLSRRLIGELLVYRGIRRPSVRRPSSTFSNDFFSEAAGPILLIFHI